MLTNDKTQCNSFFKGDKDEGRITVIWPGSAVHYLAALDNPRWEDFNYELLPEARANRFAWLGSGLTRAQLGSGKVSAFLDHIDVPPVINKGKRPEEDHVPITNGQAEEITEDESKSKVIAGAVSGLPA